MTFVPHEPTEDNVLAYVVRHCQAYGFASGPEVYEFFKSKTKNPGYSRVMIYGVLRNLKTKGLLEDVDASGTDVDDWTLNRLRPSPALVRATWVDKQIEQVEQRGYVDVDPTI